MLSGRDALATIEQTIGKARAEEGKIEAALASASEEAVRVRAERMDVLRALARVKLDAIKRGEVTEALDSVERRALDLVARRRVALEQEAREREGLSAAVAQAERLRHDRAAALERALEAFEAIRAETEARAEAAADVVAQRDAVTHARTVAEEAEKKARAADADLRAKRQPYEADPLFMYLWTRKFGTAEYRASVFVRFFDRKVANLVGYAGARANYALLNEIPVRLRAHAEARKAAVAQEETRLAEVRALALRREGAGPLIAAVDAAREALIAAEKALSAAREALARHDAARAQDTDPAYAEAIRLLADASGQASLRELMRQAQLTRTPEDDRLVRRIEEIDGAIARADREVRDLRQTLRDLATRRDVIEREREHFRQRGYDHPYGSFGNGAMIGDVLTGILKGAIQGRVLRDVLRDGYRPPRAPRGREARGRGGVVLPFPVPMPGDSWGGGAQAGGAGWTPPWLGGGWGDGQGGGLGGWGDGGGLGGGGGGSDSFGTGGSF